MLQSDKVNLASLNIVSDELVATIEQAAGRLEQFVAAPRERELLLGCTADLEQIRGTFRLLQLHGADMLADEMLELAGRLQADDEAIDEVGLRLLTGAFFVLPRYLEYTQQTRRGLPLLLITYINELRQASRKPAVPECQFFDQPLVLPAHAPRATPAGLEVEDQAALTRRLRHMYQVGLLNALQGKQVRSAFGIMQRALERLEIISGGRPVAWLWSAAAATLEVLRTNNMELTHSRKMVLSGLDREIRKLQQQGLAYLDAPLNERLLRSLLFLLLLAHRPGERADRLMSAFGLEPLGYSDQDLRRERESLNGPSGNTVASVAAVISDELRHIKESLEQFAEARLVGHDDYQELIASLRKMADILSVVGLAGASQALREQVARVEAWRDAGERADAAEMIELADAMLYVESTLAGLDSLDLSGEKLTQINGLARREVIASSQLAEAELLVIREAEAGLSLVKRALNAFAESNYDYGHIKNVATTLNTVRGAMIVLGLGKAASILEGCIEFVEQTLLASQPPAALQQLLETFADAIIGLEYYLESVRIDRQADDAVLTIAEESLQALGHRVRA